MSMLRHTLARESVKFVLGRLLTWSPLDHPGPGFSIILGVPWDLRHLLSVNLRFIARTNPDGLRRIHVIFDRTQRPGAEQIISDVQKQCPELPLTFRFHDPVAGWIVNKVNVSTFYNSMNTVLGLKDCTTRYAVLHDFDLYPLVANYFTEIVGAMSQRNLRFSGLQRTHYDELTDGDNVIGTWALGIDVPWIRAHHRPIECFHRMARVGGRVVNLDPYSYLQLQTPERALVGTIDGTACCHVLNLCSTYLRYLKGSWFKAAWRLHFLWYLEYLAGNAEALNAATAAMEGATSSLLRVGRHEIDFAKTHWTCSNVLRDEVARMEQALVGECRPEAKRFVEAFAQFMQRFGDQRPLEELRKSRPAHASGMG